MLLAGVLGLHVVGKVAELSMLKAIEEATGRKFTDTQRAAMAKGPDEQDLVNSGLEETMIAAHRPKGGAPAWRRASVSAW